MHADWHRPARSGGTGSCPIHTSCRAAGVVCAAERARDFARRALHLFHSGDGKGHPSLAIHVERPRSLPTHAPTLKSGDCRVRLGSYYGSHSISCAQRLRISSIPAWSCIRGPKLADSWWFRRAYGVQTIRSPARADPQTEINIVEVGRKRFVESTGLVEHGAPRHHARARSRRSSCAARARSPCNRAMVPGC